MSLQKKIGKIFVDEEYQIEQLCREDYERLKKKVLEELGVVAQKIREIFQECWLDSYGENSEIYESNLKERVLGLLVETGEK